jgi:methyl-accepting chemotaxis protein
LTSSTRRVANDKGPLVNDVATLHGVVSELERLAELSRGNLTVHLDVVQRDEIGDLADAFRAMAGRLRDIVGDIHGSADNVANGSRQMSETA